MRLKMKSDKTTSTGSGKLKKNNSRFSRFGIISTGRVAIGRWNSSVWRFSWPEVEPRKTRNATRRRRNKPRMTRTRADKIRTKSTCRSARIRVIRGLFFILLYCNRGALCVHSHPSISLRAAKISFSNLRKSRKSVDSFPFLLSEEPCLQAGSDGHSRALIGGWAAQEKQRHPQISQICADYGVQRGAICA